MKRWRGEATIAATAVLVLLGGRVAGPALGADVEPEILVVTHASVPLDSVTRDELSQVFLGLRSSVGDVQLNPINQAAEELRRSFLERLTGMSAARVEEHFIALVLRGEGKRPVRVTDPTDVPRLAFEVKRIVSWLTREQYEALTPAQQGLLKILAVDGRGAGDSRYLFRER